MPPSFAHSTVTATELSMSEYHPTFHADSDMRGQLRMRSAKIASRNPDAHLSAWSTAPGPSGSSQ